MSDESAETLRRSERRLHMLVDSIQDYAIYMLDPLGRVLTWNHGAQIIKGYKPVEVLGRHFRMLFVPEDILAQEPERELAEAARSGRCAGEGWRLRKDGERFWAGFVLTAVRDESGLLTGFAKVTRDLTEAKRQQDALRVVEMGLREDRDCLYHAAECTMDALYVCRALRGPTGEIEDFVFTYLNSNVEKMVTIPRSLLLGGRMCELFPVNRRMGLIEQYKQVALSGEPLVQEVEFEEETIKARWVRMQVVPVGDGIAISAADITERKRDEERIRQAAHHDELTGLPNRSLLSDRIEQAIERARRYGGKVAVFMVDLDSFKFINDTFGHSVGDMVLVAAAARLKAAVRATDSVIRMGGDEFVVVMPDICDQLNIASCAHKLREALETPIDLVGRTLQATGSVGSSVYPDCGSTVEELLDQADAAMYDAKRRGKNRSAAFSREQTDTVPASGDTARHAALRSA